jgi:hypothetical protein
MSGPISKPEFSLAAEARRAAENAHDRAMRGIPMSEAYLYYRPAGEWLEIMTADAQGFELVTGERAPIMHKTVDQLEMWIYKMSRGLPILKT